MMPFLYFPEDKSEYIPALIVLAVFIVAAVGALYLFYKHSKKQEKKFDMEYKSQIENQNKSN